VKEEPCSGEKDASGRKIHPPKKMILEKTTNFGGTPVRHDQDKRGRGERTSKRRKIRKTRILFISHRKEGLRTGRRPPTGTTKKGGRLKG